MLRITRGFVDGFIYHVINRGNSKQTVFHKDSDYQAFINLMEEAEGKNEIVKK
jgi:putative transposase